MTDETRICGTCRFRPWGPMYEQPRATWACPFGRMHVTPATRGCDSHEAEAAPAPDVVVGKAAADSTAAPFGLDEDGAVRHRVEGLDRLAAAIERLAAPDSTWVEAPRPTEDRAVATYPSQSELGPCVTCKHRPPDWPIMLVACAAAHVSSPVRPECPSYTPDPEAAVPKPEPQPGPWGADFDFVRTLAPGAATYFPRAAGVPMDGTETLEFSAEAWGPFLMGVELSLDGGASWATVETADAVASSASPGVWRRGLALLVNPDALYRLRITNTGHGEIHPDAAYIRHGRPRAAPRRLRVGGCVHCPCFGAPPCQLFEELDRTGDVIRGVLDGEPPPECPLRAGPVVLELAKKEGGS